MDEHTSSRAIEGICGACGVAVDGAFCPTCGNAIRTERLTVKGVVAEAWRQVVEFDGPVIRTMIHSVCKPHVIAQAYIDGDRKRYVNPAKFMLVSSAFVIVLLQWWGVVHEPPPLSNPGPTPTGVLIQRGLIYQSQYANLFNMLAVPVLALGLWLLFPRRQLNFAEHLVGALFINGAMSILQAVTIPFGAYSTTIAIISTTLVLFVWASWAIVRFERAPAVTGTLRSIAAMIMMLIATFVLVALWLIAYAVWARAHGW